MQFIISSIWSILSINIKHLLNALHEYVCAFVAWSKTAPLFLFEMHWKEMQVVICCYKLTKTTQASTFTCKYTTAQWIWILKRHKKEDIHYYQVGLVLLFHFQFQQCFLNFQVYFFNPTPPCLVFLLISNPVNKIQIVIYPIFPSTAAYSTVRPSQAHIP